MAFFPRTRSLRALMAYGAALCSVVIVLVQQHVFVDLTSPATWNSPLRHRCGVCMLLALAWAAAEAVLQRLDGPTGFPSRGTLVE